MERPCERAAEGAAGLGDLRLRPAEGPEDRSLSERCILWGTTGPPMVPGPYNNNYQIVQAPGYVMIVVEMIHDVRVIPTDEEAVIAKHTAKLMFG